MRIWEFEDNNAVPANLVREQDFILHVRRMQRAGGPYLILNILLNAIEMVAVNSRVLDAMHEQLQEFARVTQGLYAEMANGDVFLTWEETPAALKLPERILGAILPLQPDAGDVHRFVQMYHLPQDYVAVRERANHYVETVRASASGGFDDAPAAQALKSEAARGRLTAWSVDQIGRLLAEIDLRRYGRTQTAYRRTPDGQWNPAFEEYFVSLEDLRRERFPRLEISPSEHLFLALCEILDQRLLIALTSHFEIIANRPIHLNLSITSIMSAIFVQFVRRVPQNQRNLIGFELHRGDVLLDFAQTMNAVQALRREGFKIALDSVTPDMVKVIDLEAFGADYIKINVSKDRAAQLADPAIRKNLSRLPADRLIFFRCDNENALNAGIELGVSLFQGWLIDDLTAKK
jgi:EAL domain-containing protein (putative c-di-GMP-specific phosphodiesterase class I)